MGEIAICNQPKQTNLIEVNGTVSEQLLRQLFAGRESNP